MTILAGFALAAAVVVGQADSVESRRENLKDFKYFIGNWSMEGEIKVEGEFRGLDDVTGESLRQTMSYRWFKDRTFVLLTIRDEGIAQPAYVAVIGWDPDRKQITSTDFNYLGAHLKYDHVKRNGEWFMEGTSVYPGSAKGVYRAEITIVDDDTFRHRGSGVMEQDGKESKVTLSYVAKRVKREKRK